MGLQVPEVRSERSRRLAHVLVVEDDDRFRTALALLLCEEHAVDTAGSMAEALARLRSGAEFDVIVSDVMMPGGSGVDLYESIVREFPWHASRVVFMTGGVSDTLRERIDRLPNYCLEKPFALDELRGTIAKRLVTPRPPQ
jgi:CheY-like chemotaxis protein